MNTPPDISDCPKFSIIIANYNYEEFLPHAIDSALDLEWPRVEVIVVDDGSTDGSRQLLETYGNSIVTIFQENAGQREACNAGFAASSGDVVIFLDSDDILDPQVANEAAGYMRPNVSKVQFQMKVIDRNGNDLGYVIPQYIQAPTSEQIFRWMTTTAAYPTPPGSGNAYSRFFLEKIFPLEPAWDRAGDSFCLAAAPLLGKVVTVAKPLVKYRVHGGNQGVMDKLNPSRFSLEVERAYRRFSYAQAIARNVGIIIENAAIRKNLSVICLRVSCLRLNKMHYPLSDRRIQTVLFDTMKAVLSDQGLGWKSNLLLALWIVIVSLFPLVVARNLIQWRYIPSARPKWLQNTLRIGRVIR